MQKKKIIILSAIILVAALTRLLPHPMNFTPLGAMALFGGAYFGRNGIGLLITMLAWLLSDFILNNFVYDSGSNIIWFTEGATFIYGSIMLIYLLGSRLLSKPSWSKVIMGSTLASMLFFIITNFGVWIGGGMYPLNYEGLFACYIAAIPFFQNTLAGDLVYSAALFLIFEKILRTQLLLDRVK
jgi:hypothetical protein